MVHTVPLPLVDEDVVKLMTYFTIKLGIIEVIHPVNSYAKIFKLL